jgi:hypothetical protein
MGKYLAVFAVCLCLFAGSASACDVAVQSFGFAQPLAVQSYCAPQVQSFAVQQYAVQSYAVPSVQVFATPVYSTAIATQQQVFVQAGHHGHFRSRSFSSGANVQVNAVGADVRVRRGFGGRTVVKVR